MLQYILTQRVQKYFIFSNCADKSTVLLVFIYMTQILTTE